MMLTLYNFLLSFTFMALHPELCVGLAYYLWFVCGNTLAVFRFFPVSYFLVPAFSLFWQPIMCVLISY